MTFNEWSEKCYKNAERHGFHDVDGFIGYAWDNPDRVNSLLMMVVSEVGEACEANRMGDRENFGEEIADIFIRLGDMAYLLDIDLDEEIAKKMAKNAARPRMHGGKRV